MLLKPAIPPMEARSVDEIPTDDGWQYEPKWDGFRCLAFRDDNEIFLQSKNGQPLARYFPDVAANVATLPHQRFVLDGELVIPVGGALSFDELQLRLHPAASRVQKLATAHPAVYIVFDLLAENDESYLKLNLRERQAASGGLCAVEFAGQPKVSGFHRRPLISASPTNGLKKLAAISTASSPNVSMLRTPQANARQR